MSNWRAGILLLDAIPLPDGVIGQVNRVRIMPAGKKTGLVDKIRIRPSVRLSQRPLFVTRENDQNLFHLISCYSSQLQRKGTR